MERILQVKKLVGEPTGGYSKWTMKERFVLQRKFMGFCYNIHREESAERSQKTFFVNAKYGVHFAIHASSNF